MESFLDVIGKKKAKSNIIKSIINDELSHAYLITGPEGIGKKIFANALANAILCNNPNRGIPCGKCNHCKSSLAKGNTELNKLNTNNNSIKVDVIREIVHYISLKPIVSKKKIFLIYDGEKMTNQAQNSLLKTFEEPPSYSHIIITVNNEDAILPTLSSRAISINLTLNTNEEIREYLLSISDFDKSKVEQAISYCEGSIGKALKILSSDEFHNTREKVSEFTKNLISKKEKECINAIKEISKEEVNDFLIILIKLFKDMVVYIGTKNDDFLINVDKKYIINDGINKYNISTLLKVVFIIEDTVKRLKGNASRKLTLDGMTIRILEELIND